MAQTTTDPRTKERKKRARKRKTKKIFKGLLTAFAIIIVVLAAFLITVKLCKPDFKIASLIPERKAQQVVEFIDEKLLGKTTTEAPTTTKPTTTKRENLSYLDFEDFDFDRSQQGNQIGNLLNATQGAVTYSSSYIYYSIENDGFYRFEPNNETYTSMNSSGDTYKYLNVLGDYIYFVDTDNSTLYKSQVTGGELVTVCKGVSFVYLYSDMLYCVGEDNSVFTVSVKDFEKNVLYTPTAGKTVKFAGISLSRVFFVEHDNATGKDDYITVANNNRNDKRYFMDKTDEGRIKSLELEGGYMYYYEKQSDNSYNLIRQKFGSDRKVTLVENCTQTDYPVVYTNRVYYLDKSGSTVTAKEYNMNSREISDMVYAYGIGDGDTIGIGYGYQYVFLFGYSDGYFYRGSCIYTSASGDNTIIFKDGSWRY
ncbi:MAG: DUF5050 domain-containing protein [Eubacterium sp.]|nr:DUF5050 domain-containing protein [Eubacterium sp.]